MPSEPATQSVAGLSAGTRQQAVGGSGLQHCSATAKGGQTALAARAHAAGCAWLRNIRRAASPLKQSRNSHALPTITSLVGLCRRFRASSDKSPEQTLDLEPQNFDAVINQLQQQPAAPIAKELNECTSLATSQLILCLPFLWPLSLSSPSTKTARNHHLGSSSTRNTLGITSHRLHYVGAAHLGDGRARGAGRLRGRSVGSVG